MSDLRFSSQDRVTSSSRGNTQSDFYKTRFERMKDSKMFPLTVVALSIVVFGSIILYAYNQGKGVSQTTNVPLIVAEADPFKIRPNDPGGADIPFQDSLAYEQLNEEGSQHAESLLPPPEQAMEQPMVTANAVNMDEKDLKEQAENLVPKSVERRREIASAAFDDPIGNQIAAANNYAGIEPAAGNADDSTMPTPETDSSAKIISKQETVTEKVEVAALQQKAESPIKEQTKISAAPASGEWKVQLASFKDKSAAEAAWNKFQKQYAPHLDNTKMSISRADLGDRGIYYRVNADNLSKDAANDICGAIKNIKPQGCLVVR